MKALVIGLLIAPVLAVLAIVNLEELNSNGTVYAVQWLLFAFVPLDLLALVSVITAWLWNVRQRQWRRAIRPLMLATYAAIGVLGYVSMVAQHARDLAAYDPEGGCSGWGEDNSGCLPTDGRVGWLVFWGVIGLACAVAAAIRARRMRQYDYWYGDVADQRFA